MTKTILLLSAVCCVGCGQTTSPRAAQHVAIAKSTSAPETPSPEARLSRFDQPRDAAPASDEEHDEQVIRELRRAHDMYAEFVRRAGSEPAFAEAVTRSQDRMADIRQTVEFLERGLAERRHRSAK